MMKMSASAPGRVDPDTSSPDSLNGWYEQQVGYRPQEDDPSMTDADLRDLVRSYIEARDSAA